MTCLEIGGNNKVNIVAIDGACRGNGKPNCLSTGAAVFKRPNGFTPLVKDERPSSNQRGEMLGLAAALDAATHLATAGETELYMVMDSEFLFNALTKDWLGNWERKGWKTAEGNPVKSQDLWMPIRDMLSELDKLGMEIIPYHIKGHLVSLGKVTAAKILNGTGGPEKLYEVLWDKYDQDKMKKPDAWDNALQVFERNHGFTPDEEVFKKFVVMNTVADYVATTLADELNK
jgi:ribonuclease HI